MLKSMVQKWRCPTNQLIGSANLAWNVTGPGGFVFNTTGRNASFIVPDNGRYTVTLTVTDDEGLTATQTGIVRGINVPPTITQFVVPSTATAGRRTRLVGAATDPAGVNDPLRYRWVITGPGGFRIRSTSRVFNWIPPAGIVGRYRVRLTVLDGNGGKTSRLAVVPVTL